jgi:PTH1 family peptidyl-tRNA hydrolase
MILIAGLGNPGVKYSKNRHNLGFMVVDDLIDYYKAINCTKSSFRGELYKTSQFYFLKPQTFMNLSGESIRAVKEYFKCEDVFVIYDDLDLPFGSIRYKKGGRDGGHNGLKSCDLHIGKEYNKIRLGISRPSQDQEVVKYVLGDLSKKQIECVEQISQKVKIAIDEYIVSGFEKMMSLHSFKKSVCEEN